ncbi:FAD-binding oxidoreductase [Ramlibacter sp. H39-3-26]|uniref:ferredoxin reductase family protein n=1 Tax=Curvibacter soli TaxID=3031331 RepID=UPI0023DCC145|nr:FAD-binding oxidoreductase [Ramlibacter sp. H39-3-26]MDF1486563.1 FAD-binding oxidoreductase [Ramlibacter sp. H39-3-26]
MLALAFLVIGLFVALNRKIRYSTWRPTHKMMGLVYLLAVGHFMTAPVVLFDRSRPSGLMLMAAAVTGVLACLYSVAGMNRRTALPFTIEAVRPLERATEVVLKPQHAMMDFLPGQFVFVEVQGKGWKEPHPFTISSAPGEQRLRVTIKVLGDWTRKVRDELQPGGAVLVRGPYGKFDSARAGNQQVWVAGGIGLTPFLSMLRAMQPGDPRQILLVYAARNERDALFLGELKTRVAELGNVSLLTRFSEQGEFADLPLIQQAWPGELGQRDYFLCGPKPMTDALRSRLRKAGVARGRLHAEAFEFR